MVAAVSKEKLVLDLSCRVRDGKYFVVTDKWQTFTDFGNVCVCVCGNVCVCVCVCVRARACARA
jgi:hypothetical protein